MNVVYYSSPLVRSSHHVSLNGSKYITLASPKVLAISVGNQRPNEDKSAVASGSGAVYVILCF